MIPGIQPMYPAHDIASTRPRTAKLVLALCAAAIVASTGCEKKPTVTETDDREALISYIQSTPEGQALFRTAGLVRNVPYAKPEHEGVVFRDELASVDRHYYTNLPSRLVEKDFGAPYGIVDDAEVEVQDVFHVRVVADSAGRPPDTAWQQRVLTRSAYFMRLRPEHDLFAGWVMQGYNGGVPRRGRMELTGSDGNVLRGDGLHFERILFMKYVTTEWFGDDDRLDSTTVDSVRSRTDHEYLLLPNVGRVARGDTLRVEHTDVDQYSLFQVISAETAEGPIYRLMDHLDPTSYVDTLRIAPAAPNAWNVLFFQEFQGPGVDRPGGIWCVPYRLQ